MDYKVCIIRIKEKPYLSRAERWLDFDTEMTVHAVRDVDISAGELSELVYLFNRGTGVLGVDVREIEEGEQ